MDHGVRYVRDCGLTMAINRHFRIGNVSCIAIGLAFLSSFACGCGTTGNAPTVAIVVTEEETDGLVAVNAVGEPTAGLPCGSDYLDYLREFGEGDSPGVYLSDRSFIDEAELVAYADARIPKLIASLDYPMTDFCEELHSTLTDLRSEKAAAARLAENVIGTDGHGICEAGRTVTDASVIRHPTWGWATLAVCGARDFLDYGEPGRDIPESIGVLDITDPSRLDDPTVVWHRTSTQESVALMRLPEPYTDASGNIFLWTYFGGAHCCNSLIVLRAAVDGFTTLASLGGFGEVGFPENENVERIVGDGDAVLADGLDPGGFYRPRVPIGFGMDITGERVFVWNGVDYDVIEKLCRTGELDWC